MRGNYIVLSSLYHYPHSQDASLFKLKGHCEPAAYLRIPLETDEHEVIAAGETDKGMTLICPPPLPVSSPA